jgi:hypothetical protein
MAMKRITARTRMAKINWIKNVRLVRNLDELMLFWLHVINGTKIGEKIRQGS